MYEVVNLLVTRRRYRSQFCSLLVLLLQLALSAMDFSFQVMAADPSFCLSNTQRVMQTRFVSLVFWVWRQSFLRLLPLQRCSLQLRVLHLLFSWTDWGCVRSLRFLGLPIVLWRTVDSLEAASVVVCGCGATLRFASELGPHSPFVLDGSLLPASYALRLNL